MASITDLFGEEEEEAIGRPADAGVLAFHEGTEEALLVYVKNNAVLGNANSVLAVVDQFCYTRHWMMHVGDKKLKVLRGVVQEAIANKGSAGTKDKIDHDRYIRDSAICVELGSYCGYSAVGIASCFPKDSSNMLFCIEGNAKCVQLTRRLVEYAGLSDRVHVIHSNASETAVWTTAIAKHLASKDLSISDRSIEDLQWKIDLLFIDHDKVQYLNDLKGIISMGLLQDKSVVVADNVLCFQSPLSEYLSYVRDPTGPFATSRLVDCTVEYSIAGEDQNWLSLLSSEMKTTENALLLPSGVTEKDLLDGMEISTYRE